MKAKTLAEKLAEAPERADTSSAPETVRDAVDQAPPAAAQPSASEPGDTSGTDAMVAAAKAAHGENAPSQAAQAASKVCLIVDDSRVIRKVSMKIARSLGYTPIEAQDGEEALARCKQAMPALVLTDWNMPEMDGIEFVRRLRAIPTPNRPTVVFCTSNGEAADIHQGIGAGADDYIVKPFDEAALKAKLEKLGRD